MTFEENGIFVRGTGQVKTTCPKCSHTRKNKSDQCLSVNIDEGVWHCHHCGWKGTLKEKVKDLTIPVKKPKPPKTELPEEVYKWFEDRCITRAVVDAEKIGGKIVHLLLLITNLCTAVNFFIASAIKF